MKIETALRVFCAAVGVAVATPKSYALFGVGDIVFDPTALAELIKMYEQGQAQYQQLASIVGLNGQQKALLDSINTAVGIAKGTVKPDAITARQITALAQGFGIDANGYLSSIYQQSGPAAGALDVFMGMSLSDFQKTNSTPWKALSYQLTNTAIEAIGAGVGLESREVDFAKQVAQMSDEQRQTNRVHIAAGLATLSLKRFADSAEKRRMAVQAEANIANDAAKRAAEATTLNETAGAQAELAASNARIAAVAAQQQNEANEALLMQGHQSNAAINQMDARRAREEALARMKAKAAGGGY